MPADTTPARGLRARLRQTSPVLFAMQTIPDPAVSTILGWSGSDAVILDAEHGPFDLGSLRHCLDALATTAASSVIRVADADPTLIKRTLDLGPDGILVPNLRTGTETRAAVRACRYPPAGNRGIGSSRADRYGLAAPSYRAEADDAVAVIGMIETREGVAARADILGVDGLDGVFLGPADLAASVGTAVGAPEVARLTGDVVDTAREHGVRVGTAAPAERVGELAAAGMGMFLCYSDITGLAESARDRVRRYAGSLVDERV